MSIRYLILILLIKSLYIITSSSDRSVIKCPYFCACDLWNNLRRVTCSHKNLVSPNVEAPSVVEALDISRNSVSELQDKGFQQNRQLRFLNISHNKITDIHKNAFHDLSSLNVLDLSYNHLKYVLPQIFDATPTLQELYLTGNEIGNYGRPPVLQIPSLQRLFMKECWLDSMNEDSFSELPNLSTLDLSGNQFVYLKIGYIHSLKKLNYLNLAGNPWHCDPITQEVIEQLKNRNVDVTPICDHLKIDFDGRTGDKFEKLLTMDENSESSSEDDIETLDDLAVLWLDSKEVHHPIQTHDNIIVQQDTPKDNAHYTDNIMSQIPSFWSFIMGIQIGIVLTVVGMWTWLRCKCSQVPAQVPIRPRARSLSESVRRSVGRLRNDETNNYTELQALPCPGTPPPPYRDVLISIR